jgi:hypothetical protein
MDENGWRIYPIPHLSTPVSIHTIHLIRSKTTIPIPRIHAHDTSSNNGIKMPYMIMDFVEGIPLWLVWKDGNIIDDAAHRHIFERVARYMSQLSVFEFDKIGNLKYDEDLENITWGPTGG